VCVYIYIPAYIYLYQPNDLNINYDISVMRLYWFDRVIKR